MPNVVPILNEDAHTVTVRPFHRYAPVGSSGGYVLVAPLQVLVSGTVLVRGAG
jgi:hypothetical protein